MLVRWTDSPAVARSAITQAVGVLDPGLAVYNVTNLTDAMAVSLLPTQVAGGLVGALGMLALALAALGTYGVLSFIVRSRTREIGIRLAIGATPRSTAAMVLYQAFSWTAAGAIIGVALALLVTRFLAAFLYGISPTDPWTFAGAALLLTFVAAVAALVPAVRASRLNPLVALRSL
jgi:ABC-type antimicrobial peptide transport system permease subunit